MKKVLVVIMSILMVFSITACGKKKKAPSNNNIGSNNEINIEDYDVFYGKISSIAGNEFDVSLAKDPFEGIGDDTEKPDNGEESTPVVSSTPAMEGVAPEGEKGGAENRIELEYTGETKSLTIPTGVEIYKSNGEEVQLSSVKKGEVISIMVNKKSGVVSQVTIWG